MVRQKFFMRWREKDDCARCALQQKSARDTVQAVWKVFSQSGLRRLGFGQIAVQCTG